MKVPDMTEAEWQEQVLDLAHMLGWKHLHVRRTRGKGNAWTTSTNVKGWPDLLLWNVRRPGLGLVALELKSEGATLNTDTVRDQQAVLAELEYAGVRTMIARPSDLEAVTALLTPPR